MGDSDLQPECGQRGSESIGLGFLSNMWRYKMQFGSHQVRYHRKPVKLHKSTHFIKGLSYE
jgi:hypothetical protein